MTINIFPMLVFDSSPLPVAYDAAMTRMAADVEALQKDAGDERVWFLEHPPIYTAGTSAKKSDCVGHPQVSVHRAGRGGQYTYHGPGQRVVYLMLDLKKRSQDVRAYVRALEQLGINVLAELGVEAVRDAAGVGLWVKSGVQSGSQDDASLAKVAAIGVRISKWVTSHGIAFNVNPNLDHYTGIVPCGIANRGVISLQVLGIDITMDRFDQLFQHHFLKSDYFNVGG